MERIAVLGAGNGGQAMAGHLGMRGFDVTLFQLPAFEESIAPIRTTGVITLTGHLQGEGSVRATTDMREALEGTGIVYVVVPAFGQLPMMTEAAPYLEPGTKVVFIPGNFASLVSSNWMKRAGLEKGALLAETDTLPYACRLDEPGRVHVWGMKNRLAAAALPGNRTGELLEAIGPSFPIRVVPAGSVLEIGLSNMNMVVHCLTLLLNVGRVEATGGAFRFYTDGVTPTIGKLMEALDRERLGVAKAYGLELPSAMEWIRGSYGVEGENLYELMSRNPAYAGHGNDAPKAVRHRYVTEDVPNLLVPLEALGRAAGLETPIASSLVTLWNTALDENFRASGRDLESMGLAGLAPKEIRTVLEGGF